MPPPNPPPKTDQKGPSLPLDRRSLLIILLLVIIGVLIFFWKPWQPNIKASDRTITVTGDATLMAEPDEYVFTPSYEFKNASKQTALGEMSAKSAQILAKLKSLGVADSMIKTNAGGYRGGIYYPVIAPDGTTAYTLNLTITINDPALAQKVQDYLVSTVPSGSLSPQANFSDAKRQKLQTQARDAATKDARAKADQSAKNLGFKIAAVKSVNDGSGFDGGPLPLMPAGGANALVKGVPAPSLGVQPGQNKLQYSVTVVYYIR